MIAIGKKLVNVYSGLCMPICKKYGINQSCFDVLMFCANNPKYNTARDICTVRGIKSGIVSVSVETLIGSGLLLRQDDPEDRRIHRLVPTEAAQNIIAEGREVQRRFYCGLRNGISDGEQEVCDRVNEKILENLKLFESEENNGI